MLIIIVNMKKNMAEEAIIFVVVNLDILAPIKNVDNNYLIWDQIHFKINTKQTSFH